MEEVLRNVNKVLVDKNTSGTGGVLPYLPLPELRSGQPAAPSGSGSRPPQQPLPGATR